MSIPEDTPASSDVSHETRLHDGVEGCPLDMSRTLIMDFVHTLERETTVHGNMGIVQVRELAESFLRHHRLNTAPPEYCLGLHRALLWDERRHHPFERLLIKRFAKLMPKRHGDEGTVVNPLLSRRMIPGFMVAFIKMVGLDFYAKAEAITQKTIERQHAISQLPIDWDALEMAPAVSALIDQALLRIAAHFSNFDHRLEWMIDVINGHLGPIPSEDRGTPWVMNRVRALALLSALFADLLKRLRDQPIELEAGIGGESLATLIFLNRALAEALAPSSSPDVALSSLLTSNEMPRQKTPALF